MERNKTWRASAPSNIALIKYMGKTDASNNRPINGSLSYTLNHLRSYVELEKSTQDQDTWQPLILEGSSPLVLSQKGQDRFLQHLQRIKEEFSYAGSFIVRSANGFPGDCGLASSASSFAALTEAACLALCEETGRELSRDQVIDLSRRGSGSSCRSLLGTWVEWSAEGVREVDGFTFKDLHHLCVVVSDEKKQVSSSEAHLRVLESSLFSGRVQRVEERLENLKCALNSGNWQRAYEITWAEFWDMHVLFETSAPPFGYMSGGSLQVLNQARQQWSEGGDGPLVTMDAGANVHLLFRPDQEKMVEELSSVLQKSFSVIDSRDWNNSWSNDGRGF